MSIDDVTRPIPTVPRVRPPGFDQNAHDIAMMGAELARRRAAGEDPSPSYGKYLALAVLGPVFAAFWFLFLVFGASDPTVGMIALAPLTLIGAPILAVLWWLSDRDYADPKGTGRRVRGIGWVLTALWVGHKIF